MSSEPKIIPIPKPLAPPIITNVVGRQAELVYFTEKLETEHLAVITGMAGVGKTTLAAMLASRNSPPDKIFWHRFHKSEGIYPIIWGLAGFLAYNGDESMWRLLQGGMQTGATLPPGEILLDYIMQILRGRGYLLCFEDLQYVDVEDDPLSDHFVHRLMSEAQTGALSLIITSRHRTAFIKNSEFKQLQGLSTEDIHALVTIHGLVLPDDLLVDLHTRTEGNAELLMLVINALQRVKDPARLIKRLALTDNIEHYLLSQVDTHLTADEQAVMTTMAVLLGYPGTRDAIEAILDRGNVRRILHKLCDRYLLKVSDGPLGQQYEQHRTIQSFYYELLEERERQELHHRAGEYYASREPDSLRSASHFEQAGEFTRAIEVSTADVEILIYQGQAQPLLLLLERLSTQQLSSELQMRAGEVLGDLRYSFGNIGAAIDHYWAAIKIAMQVDPRKYIQLHRKLGDAFVRVFPPGEVLDYPSARAPNQTDAEHINRLYLKFKEQFQAHSQRHMRVFLCHSSGDKPAVRELYQQLCINNFDVWLDEKKLLPGQDWDQEIRQAVRAADVVIVCLSNASITKAGYVQKEIRQALDVADEQPDGRIFLIPAKLEKCEVPERLKRWHWVNLFEQEGFELLLRALMVRAKTI